MSAFERSRFQAYEPKEDEIPLHPDDSLLDGEDEPNFSNLLIIHKENTKKINV